MSLDNSNQVRSDTNNPLVLGMTHILSHNTMYVARSFVKAPLKKILFILYTQLRFLTLRHALRRLKNFVEAGHSEN